MHLIQKGLFLLLAITFTVAIPAVQKTGILEKCQALIQNQDFTKAMEMTRAYIQRYPQALSGYICQDLICNSSPRCSNAAENRALVLEVWEQKPKIKPKEKILATMEWPRKILQSKNWYIIASEYYQPTEFPQGRFITSYIYHYAARNRTSKDSDSAYVLEHSKGATDSYTLIVSKIKKRFPIKEYGNRRPEIFEVQKDLIEHLEKPQ